MARILSPKRRFPETWGPISRLSDLIWPQRSLLSAAIIDRPGMIEPALWGALQCLGDPQWRRCGLPLPSDPGPNRVCSACAGREVACETARATLAYDDNARKLVLDLKRGARRDGLAVFAR